MCLLIIFPPHDVDISILFQYDIQSNVSETNIEKIIIIITLIRRVGTYINGMHRRVVRWKFLINEN